MRNRILAYTVQSTLMIFTSKVLYLVAAFWNPHYMIAIIFIVAGTTALAAINGITQRREFQTHDPLIDWSYIKQLMLFSLPYLPASALIWLNTTLSSILLRHYFGNQGFHAIGIYNNAVSVASILGLIQVGFSQYWLSFVFANYKSEQNKIKLVHNYLAFSIVLFSLLIILSQNFIYLLIGREYAGSQIFFPFLLVYPCCLTISETTGLGIGISKKTYLAIIPAILNLAVNFAICYFTIPLIGTLGAAIASSVSGIIMLCVKTVIGERYYKCVTNYWKTASAVIIITLAALANYVFFFDATFKHLCFVVLIITLLAIYHNDVKYLGGVAVLAFRRVIMGRATK